MAVSEVILFIGSISNNLDNRWNSFESCLILCFSIYLINEQLP